MHFLNCCTDSCRPSRQQLPLPTASATDLLPLQAKTKLSVARRGHPRPREYQKNYADLKRRPVNFKEGQRLFLKATKLPISETSKASRPRSEGPSRIIRMVAANAAMFELPFSRLVHRVFHVPLLLPAEEEAPHLRKAPLVQKPVAANEYGVEAILGHRNSRNRKRPGLGF